MKRASESGRYLCRAGGMQARRGGPMRGRDARPALPPDGGGGALMIGEDVMVAQTEADQLRQQLLQAQKLSSVGALASSVAHEFNNILTTIINYAKLGLRPQSHDSDKVHA